LLWRAPVNQVFEDANIRACKKVLPLVAGPLSGTCYAGPKRNPAGGAGPMNVRAGLYPRSGSVSNSAETRSIWSSAMGGVPYQIRFAALPAVTGSLKLLVETGPTPGPCVRYRLAPLAMSPPARPTPLTRALFPCIVSRFDWSVYPAARISPWYLIACRSISSYAPMIPARQADCLPP